MEKEIAGLIQTALKTTNGFLNIQGEAEEVVQNHATQESFAIAKALANGYYTYRFRSLDAQTVIMGKLIK